MPPCHSETSTVLNFLFIKVLTISVYIPKPHTAYCACFVLYKVILYIASCNLFFLLHYESNIHPFCGTELNLCVFPSYSIRVCVWGGCVQNTFLCSPRSGHLCCFKSFALISRRKCMRVSFIYPGLEVLGHEVYLGSPALENFRSFSKVAVPSPPVLYPMFLCMPLRGKPI